ncbi:unnamed protein product, partial [Ilex paraguariensis]
MDQRENDDNHNSVNTSRHEPTKIRFEYEDEEEKDEILEETATESSNLEDDSAMCEPEESTVGGDKTSADYYFDSYSHFGTLHLYFFLP